MADLSTESEISKILKKRKKRNRADFLSSINEVIIYGAGNTGRDVLNLMVRLGIPVNCFLDINAKNGKKVDGIPVYLPDNNEISENLKKEAVVIIAVFNAYTDIMPILDNLKRLGYERIINFIEFHSHFSDELGDRFWLTSLDYYEGLDSVVSSGYELWADDISRNIYRSFLDFRMTGDCLLSPTPDKNQYFAEDIPFKQPTRFVDCGAFDGDTMRLLNQKYGTIESMAAFEPDLENFSRLAEFVNSGAKLAKNVHLWPCGVWSSAEQLSFSAGAGEGSSIKKGGAVTIQCVALDEVIHGLKPDFIKMDIEGAEYNAILGAKKIIHESLPDMVICLYHCPAHLWQIPLLLKSWDLGYRFYLRVYLYNGFEAVLYAVANRG